jgi:hypothetical protein
MASRRMVPTNFFKDPDIMNLSNKDTQLILIGLILATDDEGRGVAHAQMLGREMDYPPETIEQALQDLVANDLLVLYQVGRHRYWYLPRWHKWQTINKDRMTRSKYPPPPATREVSADADTSASEASADDAMKMHADSGKTHVVAEKMHAQDKVIESKPRESNVIQPNEEEDGERPEGQHPPNVVMFPTHPSPTRDGGSNEDEKKSEHDLLMQVARILHLPPDEALLRVVQDYRASPDLSLLGEADSAYAWITDPEHNKTSKKMSPRFFRNWLKREKLQQEAATRPSQSPSESSAASRAQAGTRATGALGAGLAGKSLMDLEQRYKQHLGEEVRR